MATVMMDVSEIRFTQEKVYDTFNANSAKAGGMVELMDEILSGKKTPSDLPLIRIAHKRGAYWCVDNRRLFTYKHCQLGEIPVKVFEWKDMREFELKYRNGVLSRQQSSEGRRAGVIQRTDIPFPRSSVAERALSEISVYMSKRQQHLHDAKIASLRHRREKNAAVLAAENSGEMDAAASLKSLFLAPPAPKDEVSKRNVKKRKKVKDIVAGLPGATSVNRRGGESAAGLHESLDGDTAIGPNGKKRKKQLLGCGAKLMESTGVKTDRTDRPAVRNDKKRPRITTSATSATSSNNGSVKLTVNVAQDNSSDEAYDVEVTAM